MRKKNAQKKKKKKVRAACPASRCCPRGPRVTPSPGPVGAAHAAASARPPVQVDSLFRIAHTDPWVSGDPRRTSRTVSIQNTRASGNAIHGKVNGIITP